MGMVFTAARSDQLVEIPAPGGGFYTGVPVDDLKLWLGSKYAAQVKPAVATMRNTIEDKVYVQATVGIVPSSLRELHQNASQCAKDDDLNTTSAEDKALVAVNSTVNGLLKLDAFTKHDYVKDLVDERPISYDALAGMVHLAFMYVVGDTLFQTSNANASTVKNAVPFLIKCHHETIAKKAATNHLRGNLPPKDLVKLIADHLAGSKYATVAYWTGDTKGTFDGGLTPRTVPQKQRLIHQSYTSFLRHFLNGGDIQAVLGNTQFAAPDDMPHASPEMYGQKGVQLEHRWISAEPSKDGIAAEMKKVVKEVRDLNLKNVPDDQIAAIMKAVKS